MKKMIALLLALAALLGCTACGQKEEAPTVELAVTEMRAICELSTMDCYYHNVAKYFEEDAQKGFLGIGKKDKHFWIEYSGIVRMGIDVSLVKVEVEDMQVTITIPEAKVLKCTVDSESLSQNSYIVDENSAQVEAADEVLAVSEAQRQLEETAAKDKTLLANAQQRAKSLLEEYIKNIGEAVGEEYKIDWIYVDASGNPLGTAADASAETASAETGAEMPAA